MILNLLLSVLAIGSMVGLSNEGEQSEQASEEVLTSEVASSEEQVSEEAQGVIDQATQVAEDILSKWFSPDKVAMIISWVTYAGTIVILAIKLKNALSKEKVTMSEIRKAVLESIDGKVSESVKQCMEQYLDKAEKAEGQLTAVLSDFSKILALSQENSPEARIAILEIISRIGNAPAEIVEEAKKAVEAEGAKKQEAKDEVKAIAEGEWDGTRV